MFFQNFSIGLCEISQPPKKCKNAGRTLKLCSRLQEKSELNTWGENPLSSLNHTGNIAVEE
jgi:hypothetical protein